MNLSYFIAKRISRTEKNSFSGTIHRIAVFSIGIGLGASIIAFLILNGFRETVKNKIYSFGGHLTITRMTTSNSNEEMPFDFNIDLYKNYKSLGYITHMQEYAHKAGLIKTDDDVLGVLMKGVGKSYDTMTFRSNLVAGRFIQFPDSGYANEILLSSSIASKVNASVGDQLIIHFFQNPPRFRRLNVVGIYETNLSEYFDDKVVLCDLRMIARLNDWADSVAGGLEIFIKNPNQAMEAAAAIENYIDFDQYVEAADEKYYQVFQWLHLLNRQVNILLVIILIVVSVNMISVILILVMERTQMVGMLKALGARDKLIRSVFIYNGVQLVLKGLLLGNLVGLGLCYLQYRFELITLNAKDYYMRVVPVSWEWDIIIGLNLLTLAIVTIVLLLPSAIISRIDPIKAIRFD